ncbi:linoleate 13S-lipoxygenase 2-1, chloroplastic-like isoform X1 [Prosopis cineraria]|uniref:linoleate 13S-lipoxygenase 2-1, chloroplastic-like isoform X1 n=1 Tax=Prosopis cineraria TaxID=364024 RepID=UPI00240F2E0A|nr:linoleate 13S-lipoxygenase 2-1, chloroplastic-like isoform X1 [Prosopis cineraria]
MNKHIDKREQERTMENHWKVKGTARVSKLKDLFGKSLRIELVPSNADKTTIKGEARRTGKTEKEISLYDASFEVPRDFGEVGAVLVRNDHSKEMFLHDILLDGFPQGPLRFTCDSWIQPSLLRVFFSNHKSYLPSETPSGLKRLREEELAEVRGNGDGERKSSDRIYDYDVYNDLGDPDSNVDLTRPVLGGSRHPYPRRCRTGRKPSSADPSSEKRSLSVYVPRDEAFSETKQTQFTATTVSAGVSALIQSLDAAAVDQNLGFLTFSEIDMLFKDGFEVPTLKNSGNGLLQTFIPKLIQVVSGSQQVLRFEAPDTIDRDEFFWFSDEEFARETLAGVNPCSIKLVKEWPLISKLNPTIYGPPESAITRDVIEQQISGYTTVEKAIEEKKLFIIDYHDLLLPYVSKVRQLEGRTLYGSRTVFFLTAQGTLKPLAIELTRPPMDGKPQWRQVFTPSSGSTNLWLWRLAKAHVLAHDSGVHELVSHWLRSHCAVEPFVIATNRQLSAMHPIYRLLHPHLRYTMEINALARQALISANGIIEISFSTGKYSMEFSSEVYDQLWRFDLQALPNDLIDRGMAEKDPNAPHGLKLTIEDYPFANDGLLIWDALKQWFTDYVTHYYPFAPMQFLSRLHWLCRRRLAPSLRRLVASPLAEDTSGFLHCRVSLSNFSVSLLY